MTITAMGRVFRVEEEKMNCCFCRKEITEAECSKDYKVAMCKYCAGELHHYGSE